VTLFKVKGKEKGQGMCTGGGKDKVNVKHKDTSKGKRKDKGIGKG
jgi:hypothetical protein